jgi:hypothetical protein
MTSKVYRSAQGKAVDLGTIILQNENVRAVGNMKVNARGDKINNMDQVIETKTQQIQRQNDRVTTNVSTAPVHTSTRKNRDSAPVVDTAPAPVPAPVVDPVPEPAEVALEPLTAPAPVPDPVIEPAPVEEPSLEPIAGGLAEAIARSREIKQKLDKTRRQQAQDKGLRKI